MQFPRTALLALAIATACQADPAALKGTSATQAVLTYTAAPGVGCTIRVSENPSLSLLVNDVNPDLFPGADRDLSRSSTLVTGIQRHAVIGLRTSAPGLDNRLYSRALQAFTQHYYSIACAGKTIKGSFTTLNPPLGETAPEAPPFDAAGFGNYAWPSIDWSDPGKLYIDPMTGLALKRISSPSWRGYINAVKFAAPTDGNGNWSHAEQANSGSAGGLASYSGSTSDPLFLPLDATTLAPFYDPALAGFSVSTTIDDVRLKTFGFGTADSADDRTVLVCITTDSGQSCATPEIPVILPASSGPGPVVPAAGFPKPGFGSWSSAALQRDAFSASAGIVSTNGTTVSLNDTADPSIYFNRDWVAGTKIRIGGSVYTIASVNNSTSLTLTASAGSQTKVPYQALANGFRVRKQTASGTVNFSASFDTAIGTTVEVGGNGSTSFCSTLPQTVAVTAGGDSAPPRTAYVCLVPRQNPGDGVTALLMAFFPDNGESRLLSNFGTQPDWSGLSSADVPAQVFTPGPGSFDASDPATIYARAQFSNGDLGLIRITYTGDFREYVPGYFSGGSFPADSLKYTVLNKISEGRGIAAQIAALKPSGYNAADFPFLNFYGVEAGYAVFTAGTGSPNETPAFVAAVALDTGAVKWIRDTWTTYPMRYGAIHNLERHSGWSGLIVNVLRAANPASFLAGPFNITPLQMNKNGTWSMDTSLGVDDGMPCSANIPAWLQTLGANAGPCIKIRAQQPCSSYPNLQHAENVKFPCPWDASKSMLSALTLGDEFKDPVMNGEHFRVVGIQPFDAATYELELQRKTGASDEIAFCGQYPSYCQHANAWVGYMVQPVSTTVAWWWFDQDGNRYADQPFLSDGHPDIGEAPTPGNYSTIGGGGGPSTNDYSIRFNQSFVNQVGKPADYTLSGTGTFQGQSYGGGIVESYMSARQTQPSDSGEKRWFLDFRHLNSYTGVGAERKIAYSPMPYSLVSGTASVYKVTQVIGTPHYKDTPFLAFAGRYLLRDNSKPASGEDSITDDTPWTYCYALGPGECRQNSTAGDMYIAIPKADVSDSCYTNWYSQTYPCVVVPYPVSGWMVQWDASQSDPDGTHWRKLSMGLSGPGRQYQFANTVSDPTGKWGFFQCYWCDGVRNELFATKLPPFPGTTVAKNTGSGYVPVEVAFDGNASAPLLRVAFGYVENGAIEDLFCTSRHESCVVSDLVKPFAFSKTERFSASDCGKGQCSLTIPALAGRILFYREERYDRSGKLQQLGAIKVIVVPTA